MSEKQEIIIYQHGKQSEVASPGNQFASIPVPPIIDSAGAAAQFAWQEFFEAQLANPHTRKNYIHAVTRFLSWAEAHGLHLLDIVPLHVGSYIKNLKAAPARGRKHLVAEEEMPLATPTKKLHLAALRGFFDCLVQRHAIAINPASTARTERYKVIEGKTPHIPPKQAEQLLASIPITMKIEDASSSPDQPLEEAPDLVGLRDKAVLSVLIYTAARVGAVAKLTLKDLRHDGTQYTLRFAEKGGKAREIPVRHDLERLLLSYIQAAGINGGPLFRTTTRKTGILTEKPMTAIDICRMMKRRLKGAGLATHYSPHSFRVTTITDLLGQDVPLEDVAYLAGHSDTRTTRLYDRSGRKVTRNLVERISIDLDAKRKQEEPK